MERVFTCDLYKHQMNRQQKALHHHRWLTTAVVKTTNSYSMTDTANVQIFLCLIQISSLKVDIGCISRV